MNDYDNSVQFNSNLTIGNELLDKRTDNLNKRWKLGGYSKGKNAEGGCFEFVEDMFSRKEQVGGCFQG